MNRRIIANIHQALILDQALFKVLYTYYLILFSLQFWERDTNRVLWNLINKVEKLPSDGNAVLTFILIFHLKWPFGNRILSGLVNYPSILSDSFIHSKMLPANIYTSSILSYGSVFSNEALWLMKHNLCSWDAYFLVEGELKFIYMSPTLPCPGEKWVKEIEWGFPSGSVIESTYQCKRHGFDLCLGKPHVPWSNHVCAHYYWILGTLEFIL